MLLFVLLALIAGPALGSLLGISIKPTASFLCSCFAFAAGVMVAVSFINLIPEALDEASPVLVALSFLAGFVLMYVLDQILPHFHPISDSDERPALSRTTLTLIVGISLHNLPEGFAVGASLASASNLGLIVALAISLHDIPETIVPVSAYLAVKRTKIGSFSVGWITTAFTLLGFFIGNSLAEAISADMIAYAIAATAGVMVYITVDELIPASLAFKMPHLTNVLLASGVLFVVLLHEFA